MVGGDYLNIAPYFGVAKRTCRLLNVNRKRDRIKGQILHIRQIEVRSVVCIPSSCRSQVVFLMLQLENKLGSTNIPTRLLPFINPYLYLYIFSPWPAVLFDLEKKGASTFNQFPLQRQSTLPSLTIPRLPGRSRSTIDCR